MKRLWHIGSSLIIGFFLVGVVGCSQAEIPEPTPIPPPSFQQIPEPTPEPEPEPTIEEEMSAKLQDYLGKEPSSVYSPTALQKMLDFAEDNTELVADFDGRRIHILTEFLIDNPEAAEYPVAVAPYVDEINVMIFDYCQRDYDEYVREAINLNWGNFLPYIESGQAVGHRFLPRDIFITDLIERQFAAEIDDKYNDNIERIRSNLIEVAYKNIENFQGIRNGALIVIESPDYVEEDWRQRVIKMYGEIPDAETTFTSTDVLVGFLGWNVWPNSAKQAECKSSASMGHFWDKR